MHELIRTGSGWAPLHHVMRLTNRFSSKHTVQVGDGRTANKFSPCCWTNGRVPRDLTPNLYKLAWRKNLTTVRDEVENQDWARGYWRMSAAVEMAERSPLRCGTAAAT